MRAWQLRKRNFSGKTNKVLKNIIKQNKKIMKEAEKLAEEVKKLKDKDGKTSK